MIWCQNQTIIQFFFPLATEMKKKKTNMNKSVDLGLSIMIKPVKQ